MDKKTRPIYMLTHIYVRTLVNIYSLNIGAPKYVKHILMDVKGNIDSNTVIAGNFNTSLRSMDRSSRKRINKDTDLK